MRPTDPVTAPPFEAELEELGDEIAGPLRSPQQLLATQQYDAHASIHDDATAQKLGFRGGTIEGPTHFSQFAPLCVAVWGSRWLAAGCLSAHYRNPCFAGERVRAYLRKPAEGAGIAEIRMLREDGLEILRGTASVGSPGQPTALESRLASLPTPERLVILRDVRIGMRTQRIPVRMDFDQHMGELYPFSLADKLRVITEPSPWYAPQTARSSPWSRAIIPFEMVSVLLNYVRGVDSFPVRGPVVGLFADQEIRMLDGPLLVGEPYEIEREVVALSGSRRTESMWIRTQVFRPGEQQPLAAMLLNSASLKDSYANYAAELAQLGG